MTPILARHILTPLGILALPMSVAQATEAPAAASNAQQYQQWIIDMKAAERGTFARIRWFCNDGRILPPKAYACGPQGGQVVGEDLSAEMKAMLGDPGINHKYVKGLARHPEAKSYRKSGSWKRWHGDSALIEAGDKKYIVVGLVEDTNGGAWLSRMIGPIHELMAAQK